MKVSLNWVKDYVNLDLTPHELAEKLTMAGLEVKGIETIGSSWDNVVVGQIAAINPHPNADRLKLATVNTGKELITVICGAPNIDLGQKVPFASVGAQLIDGHTGENIVLRPAKIRGVTSQGMICSEKELGISDSHEGIMVLSPDAPVGIPLNEYLGDAILDLDVTPNRPDCLSIIGVAREIAALTRQELHLPQVHYEESEIHINSHVSVDIVAADLCSRYCASLVLGVKSASSPDWLQQRLRNCGMRPINNIVDVTNYVMLEYGQPLHAFDYDKLGSDKDIHLKQIIVRRAAEEEMITSLDGLERNLKPDMLVIADEEKPIAIAGVMGGWDSEVTKETSAVLLESANFNRAAIRKESTYLQLQSEASIRFDKGLNPDLPMPALKRATQLVCELSGGKAAKGLVDVYPGRTEPKSIMFPVYQVERLTGLKVSLKEIIETLTFLGFDCEETSSSQVSVSVPYWRSDVQSTADLVEEVVRITGYDKVPTTRLSSPIPARETTVWRDFIGKLRHTMVGFGFQEILTYSLLNLERWQNLSPASELKVKPLKIANPMTREQEFLRTNLRSGILTTLSRNQRYQVGGMKLFEIGKAFLPQGKGLPQEKEMLCAALSGPRTELHWWGGSRPFDFFDAKGIVEALMRKLRLDVGFEIGDDGSLAEELRANVISDHDKAGIVGLLNSKVTKAFELSGEIYLIELDLEKLIKTVNFQSIRYQPIQRFPLVSRDIALVVNDGIAYQKVAQIVQSFPLVKEVTLFDLYRGEQIPEGKKSFALRIVYQSAQRTLTDEDVEQTQQQMLDRLQQELGATLRV
mgnify:CR=1 FL=1